MGQRFSQAPQLLLSPRRSAQYASRQSVCPDGHVPHIPPVHTCPAMHDRPHIPQLRASLERLTHTPLQLVCPVEHVVDAVHAPALHVWPVGHTRPHIPQLLVSRAVSAQVLPQGVKPGMHMLVTQAPAVQLCPAAQARPQEPQWLALLCVSTQAPAQSVSPVEHMVVPDEHVPTLQVCPAGHMRPHMPQ